MCIATVNTKQILADLGCVIIAGPQLSQSVGSAWLIYNPGKKLRAGACGALAGAILGVNLLICMKVGDMKYSKILKAFAVGHKNILTNKPVENPEPFNVGKEIVKTSKKRQAQ